MLKYLSVILIFASSFAIAQNKESAPTTEIAESAESALVQYLKLREGYKRSDSKQFSKMEQLEMDDWCFAMEKTYPDAWQTDFAWYLNGHFMFNHDKLIEAYSKEKSDKRVVKAVFGYYAMKKDLGKQKELLSKVSTYYSANELAYYEDALPASGVLIVSSEKEALPLYVLQLAKGKGKGVTVVCMDYLINKDYRLAMAHKLGTGSANFFGDEKTFIQTALGSRDVHLSATVSQSYISSMGSNAFVTGLHYEGYVSDQKDKLEGFWIRLATKNFSSLSLSSKEKRLYTNYLPPLMTLYKIKSSAGDKDETLKKAILVIAEKVGQTKNVNEILKDYDNG